MSPFRGIGVPKASDVKRIFLLVVIITLLALSEGFAGAQQATKVPRIGYLGLDDPSSSFFKSFREGLREVGYIEGQNIIIEPRFAFGNDWRLGGLAAELVRLKVDVIVTQHVITARGVTRTIPIVMAYSGDPVEARIVASVERPGGNVTGIGGMATGVGGKWLEILKQTIPEVRRVGVLYFSNPDQNFRNPARQPPIMKRAGDCSSFAPGGVATGRGRRPIQQYDFRGKRREWCRRCVHMGDEGTNRCSHRSTGARRESKLELHRTASLEKAPPRYFLASGFRGGGWPHGLWSKRK